MIRQIAPTVARSVDRGRILIRYTLVFVKWRLVVPALMVAYYGAVKRFSNWTIAWPQQRMGSKLNGQKRIAYYLWYFPTLSETFIQQEIAALIKARASVEVIAHETGQFEFLGEDAKRLMDLTHYLKAVPRRALARYGVYFLRRRPFAFLSAFLFTVVCRYDVRKSPALDLELFARALHLADVLKAKKANHVHAPWASLDAFVAMLAARLLQIPFTVQARAYDIHRHTSKIGFDIKLRDAAFVITNSNYNESVIRSRLAAHQTQKIHIIYDGINLDPFRPNEASRRSGKARILSVGNLVEPKGFEYLMLACKLLKEQGYEIVCEIIGGRVTSETNYHIKLLKLHKALGLKEIVFLGRQPFDYVLKKYEAADMFVLPCVTASHGGRDITPNVLMEAMAMKLPVVSTISGAIPEVVENGMSGLLVPPRDEQALAEALVRLIQDPALRQIYGRNGRKRVEERFDATKNATAFVSLF